MAEFFAPLRDLAMWVSELDNSIALRESTYGYAVVLTAHLVSMCLFAGLILMMDLRLVGWGNLRTPIAQLQRRLFPWQMLGFALSAVTGLLLVYSQPFRYYGKVFFWTKMVLMMLADGRIDALREAAKLVVSIRDRSKVDAFARELAGMVGVDVEAEAGANAAAGLLAITPAVDAHRRAVLRRVVRDVCRIFGAHQIDYWCDFGTLLGFYRERDIISRAAAAGSVSAGSGEPHRPVPNGWAWKIPSCA